jgi:heme/copper-type cytochrome/quinol oxidase subunit 4
VSDPRPSPSVPDAGHETATPHPTAGPRTYALIAVFLFLLTGMEVAVFYIPALAGLLVPVLVLLAIAKFALVAMFYMHLRFDHPWFTYVFVGPLVVATGLALAILWLMHIFGSTGLRPPGTGG